MSTAAELIARREHVAARAVDFMFPDQVDQLGGVVLISVFERAGAAPFLVRLHFEQGDSGDSREE